jgi:hypothetical protein
VLDVLDVVGGTVEEVVVIVLWGDVAISAVDVGSLHAAATTTSPTRAHTRVARSGLCCTVATVSGRADSRGSVRGWAVEDEPRDERRIVVLAGKS